MNPRFKAISQIGKRPNFIPNSEKYEMLSEKFGRRIFSLDIMQKMFSKEIYKNLCDVTAGLAKLKMEYADTIAMGMKDWAIKHGATHYCHWFQPLTGAAAEKHDAFIDWDVPGRVIEKFSGKQLLQGEPDASSFPSGGLRSTSQARGYTVWDPSSPAFLWNAGDGLTLCIPSMFYSWTGDILDAKTPLLRSDHKLNKSVMRLLKLTGTPACFCFSTLGIEQEYFIIDQAFLPLRPDLQLLGRTVYGAGSPKGQELEDHYFGPVKDRILAFMRSFEDEALELGIPVKTRHNEVAPSQFEIAPVYEKALVAIDHNLLLMQLMRQAASKHNLACLLHEKPFEGINGSGKHCNWSIATDTGINLLNPTETPENSLNFIILISAILKSLHRHSPLLRAAIGSAGNDFRLGANEAPPAILSVYLGEALEACLNNIEQKGAHTSSSKMLHDFGLILISELPKDDTDRNRTSPFAFTGNKFELRAVGSSSNPSFPITVLNAIVAQSLDELLDEIETKLNSKPAVTQEQLLHAAIPVIRQSLKQSKNIRFIGDNYSKEWQEEAKKRELSIIPKSLHSYKALTDSFTKSVFKGILSPVELHSRFDVMVETHCKIINIQINLMLEMFRTQILPAAIEYQSDLAKSMNHCIQAGFDLSVQLLGVLDKLSKSIDQAIYHANELEELKQKAQTKKLDELADHYCDLIEPKCKELRQLVDKLESIVDDRLWPLPKYRELLFIN